MSTVDISYAQGWDAGTRRAYRPLTAAAARLRDRAGEPYVVIHREPGRAEPVSVYLVAWADHHVGHWMYDEAGRRTREFDLRLLEPDRLFVRRVVERRYSAPDQPDRARDAWRTTLILTPGGRAEHIVEEQGEAGPARHGWSDLPEAQWWIPREAFGVDEAGDQHDPYEAVEPEPAGSGEGQALPAALWRAPRPYHPEFDVQELLRPGNRFDTDNWGELTVDRVEDITTVRVPSGRLVVADPLYRGAPRELTERIPPGEYPLQTAVLVGEGEYEGERFPVTEEPLVRLLISEAPAVTWELGLGEKEDPRLLPDREAYGFPTDAAQGAFADATAWETLADAFRRCFDEGTDDGVQDVRTGSLRIADDTTGGDLVSFHTEGDGAWPVWLGRAASGALVSVVVITGRLSDFRPVRSRT
ncbi:DUF4241 domain-containing protein [Streptomyces sp. NPDC021562]|uniref:DUF4241 domain-containing protein n=1 Tax=Streptomyces sp. NPDC021562 TaxID=3155121 RepID=UPI0033D9E573